MTERVERLIVEITRLETLVISVRRSADDDRAASRKREDELEKRIEEQDDMIIVLRAEVRTCEAITTAWRVYGQGLEGAIKQLAPGVVQKQITARLEYLTHQQAGHRAAENTARETGTVEGTNTMDAIPSSLDGLMVLLAGLAAWLISGAVNKRISGDDAARTKAVVSLVVLVACTLAAYYAKQLIRGAGGGEQDFMSMLALAFSAQKAFFMVTDSLLGLTSPTPPAPIEDPTNNEGAPD